MAPPHNMHVYFAEPTRVTLQLNFSTKKGIEKTEGRTVLGDYFLFFLRGRGYICRVGVIQHGD